MTHNIYKLSYYWYEGEKQHYYVVSPLEMEEFEELLKKNMEKLNLIPEGDACAKRWKDAEECDHFHLKCLPEAYYKLLDFLERDGCILVSYPYQDIDYQIQDDTRSTFSLSKHEKITKNTTIGGSHDTEETEISTE